MSPFLLSLLLLTASADPPTAARQEASFLWRPAYCLDDKLRGPAESYVPQPGDIFLATDQARWSRTGHWLAGGGGVHHSAIIFQRSNGSLGLIEAGPFNSVTVEILNPFQHMHNHVAAGDCVWLRRRRTPLTAEQSANLTAFVEAQEGKPFAVRRLMLQVTPFRTRGPLRTWLIGGPHGDRDKWICSEMVTEACVAAGLMEPTTARPSATYPRDLFYGRSLNWYLDAHLDLSDWDPPARWTEGR
jgi:hypothetical protein